MTAEQKREQIKLALQAGHWVEIEDFDTLIAFCETREYPYVCISDSYKEKGVPFEKAFKIIPRPQYEYKVGDRVMILGARGGLEDNDGRTAVIAHIDSDDDWEHNIRVEYEHELALQDDFNWYISEWLCPLVEDKPEETVEIAGKKYSKKEFETAVKDLKEIK